MKYLSKGLLALALLSQPLWAQEEEAAWKLRLQTVVPAASANLPPAPQVGTNFSSAFMAYALAESKSQQAQQRIAPYLEWLKDYPEIREVHGQREPAWIRGEAEQVALITLALIELDRLQPDARRREQIAQFAQGLALLRHPDTRSYPFGAHTSFDGAKVDNPPYAPILDRTGIVESKAPGALWRPECSYQVKALARASDYLGDKVLLEDAQVEGLGIWSHLVTSNRWVWGFAPRPIGSSPVYGSAAAVDNFLALYNSTQQPHYQMLAALAGQFCLEQKTTTASQKSAQDWVRARLQGIDRWKGFRTLEDPVSYQVMEAENGRAVQKAFDTFDIEYPGGEPGKMVRVGRDQMFWMRFDVEREGDYFFYLIFLKSKLEGGLVSVLMRIDGDKIFQVNLGGASDAYVDMDFVDGPRPLRSGPHSFGIRFAGLLMTQPAVLDAVVAWPVVERRYLGTSDGRRLLLLHNLSQKPARATYPELGEWPPQSVGAVNRTGQAATLERESDKRRRKEYVIVPAGGLAWLEWRETKATKER